MIKIKELRFFTHANKAPCRIAFSRVANRRKINASIGEGNLKLPAEMP